ncbi:periplasmic chaperone for outer membrane proteins Skp [Halopseudomonas xinjiangensis]|uniref:Periplasmic chaperone for outer membrane proteins Skp n=1 Tax=Halopseudomonas xinjiangensis TaxID=487184 RepID=A0A1H1V0L2_9GAMM|nr:OmpH family outer membrane protein [Halopseudomonas xinjiangensis]SDS78051.1 periplasmic chaperone for outer membrane proteins Skp [Halopseudomonas xinjiangensis]
MRKLISVAAMSLMVLASFPAAAEMKIAVLDYQMALVESDAAKRYSADAEKKYGTQVQRLRNLESEAKRLQERMQQDGEKLDQTEKEKLDLEFRQKAREFQSLSRELNEQRAKDERQVVETLRPKLEEAVQAIIQSGNYDLVIDRSAVVDVKPDFDITRQVIERLNSAR